MSSPKSVALITMSTRGIRVGPAVAEIVESMMRKPLTDSGIAVVPVDLADFKLPVFDEAVVPATVPEKASFAFAHSRAWSAEVKRHDGYVLVVPEYNGMAGGTKNAIDYLYHEWRGKPVAVVSYGAWGGRTANDQVRDVLARVGLRVCETRPALAFTGGIGAEMYMASREGRVGPETRKAWGEEEEKRDVVVKAATELRDLLLQPNTETNAPRPE